MFTGVNVLVVLMLGFIEGTLGMLRESDQSVLAGIYQLAIFLPSIAVGVRRMHDTNHSGWWIIVPIVSVVFAVMEGTRGENRFGSDPKAALQTA